MSPFSPPASLLFLLLFVAVALQRSDLRLAYVTHSSFFYYSCSQDPQPCSVSRLTDCRCKEIQLCPHLHPKKSFTVWFTSPSNLARCLNNSEIKHLTLIHCGAGGPGASPSSSPEGYFAVKHLERLTVVNWPDVNRAKSTDSNVDPDRDNGADLDTFSYIGDTNLDLIADTKQDFLGSSSPQVQDILLGRELGAAFHEQARLGIIHSSVLEWGAAVKAYTVKTHIDSDGQLPFPDLHLQKLPATPVIYVSFVY